MIQVMKEMVNLKYPEKKRVEVLKERMKILERDQELIELNKIRLQLKILFHLKLLFLKMKNKMKLFRIIKEKRMKMNYKRFKENQFEFGT